LLLQSKVIAASFVLPSIREEGNKVQYTCIRMQKMQPIVTWHHNEIYFLVTVT